MATKSFCTWYWIDIEKKYKDSQTEVSLCFISMTFKWIYWCLFIVAVVFLMGQIYLLIYKHVLLSHLAKI